MNVIGNFNASIKQRANCLTKKSKILKWFAIIVSLVAFQTLTYFILGQKQLKNKLLPEYFVTLTHHSDSIFVRDFYVSDCYSGDPNSYSSDNLCNDEMFIKEKFNVTYVYFDKLESFSWNDTTEKKYNLVYNTWTSRYDWLTMFGLYGASQTETLLADKKYFYKRQVTYHWVLFFWIKTFEWFESSETRLQVTGKNMDRVIQALTIG